MFFEPPKPKPKTENIFYDDSTGSKIIILLLLLVSQGIPTQVLWVEIICLTLSPTTTYTSSAARDSNNEVPKT